MSPATTPANANVPVDVEDAVVIVPSVTAPIVVLPEFTFAIFGPEAPISSVPTVARPVLLIVVEAIVPSVFVPVEDVKPVAKVVAPLILGIVALLIVAVLIVAVPKVAVPVEAVMLDPKVIAPS